MSIAGALFVVILGYLLKRRNASARRLELLATDLNTAA